jgi:hypothetical protein
MGKWRALRSALLRATRQRGSVTSVRRGIRGRSALHEKPRSRRLRRDIRSALR